MQLSSLLILLPALVAAAPSTHGDEPAAIVARGIKADLAFNRDRIRDYGNGALGSIDARRNQWVGTGAQAGIQARRDGIINGINNAVENINALLNSVPDWA